MITTLAILNAINAKLHERYSGSWVYRDNLPKDFVRPSFFIGPDTQTITGLNKYTLSVEQSFFVQYIDEVDKYDNASTDRMMQEADGVSRLFAGQALTVGDRCVLVTGVSSKNLQDYAEVTVTVGYTDSVAMPPQEELPMMADVKINKGVK